MSSPSSSSRERRSSLSKLSTLFICLINLSMISCQILTNYHSPFEVFKACAVNVLRSCMFMGTYVAIFRYLTCILKNYRGKVDRLNVIIAGFLCTFGILWEPAHRRSELAIYFIPRFLEASWATLEKRGYVQSFQYGEVLIFAIAMGIIMYCY